MKRTTIRRTVVPVGMAIMAGLPMGQALAASKHHTTAKSSKTQTYKGPTIDERYGPVQVTISVKNKKITTVKVVNAPDSARGGFIQGQAIPALKQETLQAQSAHINEISGATQTSDSYIQSLQSAVSKAKNAKALK